MVFGEEKGSALGMVVVLLILAVAAMGYMLFAKPTAQNYYVGPAPPDANTVSVSGEARTSIAPDEGTIAFTVQTNRSGAREAQEVNAEIVQRIKQALLSEGVREEELETTSFVVQPVYQARYDCPEGIEVEDPYYDCIYAQDIIGYETVHGMQVKTAAIEKTGALADRIVEAGGNEAQVDSVGFDLREETRAELEKQLLQQASTNAKNKAERIAAGLAVHLGKPTQVSESVQYPAYYGRAMYDVAEAMAPSAAIPSEVFAGKVEVTAQVSATFELN